MGAPKGRIKAGGRQKGGKNKDKAKAQAIADRLGVDPFEVILLFAKGDWEKLGYPSETHEVSIGNGRTIQVDVIQPELRQKSAADACKYLLPQLKATELTHTGPVPVQVTYIAQWGAKEEPSDKSEDKKDSDGS